MKGIITTTYHKINNTEYFLGKSIGEIITFTNIPKSFVSLTYNPTLRTDGYQLLDESIHLLDGFYDVIIPTYDESIENLGEIFFDETLSGFTYPIVSKTQQEQDNYQQDVDDNDGASISNNSRKVDGVILFDRIMSEIERRFLNSQFTGQQAKILESTLYPLIEPLYKGLWRLVKDNLDNTTPVNATYLIVFNWVKNKVDGYVTNNY